MDGKPLSVAELPDWDNAPPGRWDPSDVAAIVRQQAASRRSVLKFVVGGAPRDRHLVARDGAAQGVRHEPQPDPIRLGRLPRLHQPVVGVRALQRVLLELRVQRQLASQRRRQRYRVLVQLHVQQHVLFGPQCVEVVRRVGIGAQHAAPQVLGRLDRVRRHRRHEDQQLQHLPDRHLMVEAVDAHAGHEKQPVGSPRRAGLRGGGVDGVARPHGGGEADPARRGRGGVLGAAGHRRGLRGLRLRLKLQLSGVAELVRVARTREVVVQRWRAAGWDRQRGCPRRARVTRAPVGARGRALGRRRGALGRDRRASARPLPAAAATERTTGARPRSSRPAAASARCSSGSRWAPASGPT